MLVTSLSSSAFNFHTGLYIVEPFHGKDIRSFFFLIINIFFLKDVRCISILKKRICFDDISLKYFSHQALLLLLLPNFYLVSCYSNSSPLSHLLSNFCCLICPKFLLIKFSSFPRIYLSLFLILTPL